MPEGAVPLYLRMMEYSTSILNTEMLPVADVAVVEVAAESSAEM